jgi:hypothetical protein
MQMNSIYLEQINIPQLILDEVYNWDYPIQTSHKFL